MGEGGRQCQLLQTDGEEKNYQPVEQHFKQVYKHILKAY
jgi:hypothetical protein